MDAQKKGVPLTPTTKGRMNVKRHSNKMSETQKFRKSMYTTRNSLDKPSILYAETSGRGSSYVLDQSPLLAAIQQQDNVESIMQRVDMWNKVIFTSSKLNVAAHDATLIIDMRDTIRNLQASVKAREK